MQIVMLIVPLVEWTVVAVDALWSGVCEPRGQYVRVWCGASLGLVPRAVTQLEANSSFAHHSPRGDKSSKRSSCRGRAAMPPPSVPCPSCGRAFFANSLSIHLPQCQQKMAMMVVPCPACGLEIRQGELNEHMSLHCKVARQKMAPSPLSSHRTRPSTHRSTGSLTPTSGKRTPSSPSSRSRPQTERAGSSSGRSRGSSSYLPLSTGAKGSTAAPAAPMSIGVADADGRVPCARCGRKFAPDRIAQHQFICVQLKRGPAKPPDEVRERAEHLVTGSNWRPGMATRRQGGGAAPARAHQAVRSRGAASRAPARPAAAPPQPQPGRWRAQSAELQEAMRAARAAGRQEVGGGWGGGGGRGGCGGGRDGRSCASGGPSRVGQSVPAARGAMSGGRPGTKPGAQTMAQRKHAAEAAALHDAAAAGSSRNSHRSLVDGSRIATHTASAGSCFGGSGGGGGFPGSAAMMQRGMSGANACSGRGGGGGGGAGFDPTSNRTSSDHPFYRGF